MSLVKNITELFYERGQLRRVSFLCDLFRDALPFFTVRGIMHKAPPAQKNRPKKSLFYRSLATHVLQVHYSVSFHTYKNSVSLAVATLRLPL
jgi:hypothetical protein